jgi:hypothetical protein
VDTFQRERDNEEVLRYIEKSRWKSSQEKDRYRKVFNWVTDYKKVSYLDALKRLENMIFVYDQFFFGDIDVLESEVNCPLAGIRINSRMEIAEVSLACPLKCLISDFLKHQKNNLTLLQKKMRRVNHMGLVVAILQRAIENPDNCDEDVCKTLADIIIVLEAPDDFLICSNNIKHFEPMCIVLGKRFEPIRY